MSGNAIAYYRNKACSVFAQSSAKEGGFINVLFFRALGLCRFAKMVAHTIFERRLTVKTDLIGLAFTDIGVEFRSSVFRHFFLSARRHQLLIAIIRQCPITIDLSLYARSGVKRWLRFGCQGREWD